MRTQVVSYGPDIGGEARLARGQAGMARARLMTFLGDREGAEPVARAALADFAGAMNWLEDAPDFEVAHFRLDEAGRWIRETFGCWLKQDGPHGRDYFRACPADFAHLRVGVSPGMKNVIRVCSICGLDPRADGCGHVKGALYEVRRMAIDGRCNLCGEETCGHADGEPGITQCFHTITSADLEEVSMVQRPAQPMARITEMEMDLDELREDLGRWGWEPGMRVSCDRCLRPCHGVREFNPRETIEDNAA